MDTANTTSQAEQIKTDTHQTACEESYYAQPYSLDATGFYFTCQSACKFDHLSASNFDQQNIGIRATFFAV